jgi:outer membrane protein assembly factor BamB
MPESEAVRAMTCPSCGAQIHVAEGQFRTTCEYCGALLELPHPSKPEAAVTIIVPPPNVLPKRPKTIDVQPRRWGQLAIILALVIFALAGGIVYLVYQGMGSVDVSSITSALSSLRVSTPAMLIPGGDGQVTDALVHTYDSSNDTRFLAYLDGGTQTVRWQTDPLGEDSYRVAMAGNDKFIFAAVKTGVMALDRQTGQVAWQASISDELPYSCSSDCLRLVGQRVVVLAKDGGLYGLDSQSGRTVWSTRLNSTPDRLYVTDDRVAVFDNRDEGVVLSIIDPVSGRELVALHPKCTDPSSGFTDDADLNSPVLTVPDQNSLIILFGFFSSCVQRWDIASGSLMWDASLSDISFSFSFGPSPALIGGTIYVASEHQLVSVQAADGTWRVLIDDPDYEFVPLEEQDGILITRAKRTRGTTRFELWGVDATTGGRIWQHPFPGGEPLDEPDRMSGLLDKGDLGWTAHLTPAGLVVVQATAQPHQLTVETLDPKTGTSGGTHSVPLSGVSGDFYSVPDVLGWPRDQLWLMVDGRIYVVNLTQPSLAYRWP